ncbi:Galactose-binding domain-like [Acididesulfobacillus acetoxydans]|uniref:Galactose-binding domain-like n=1 Tax=Acididesulfobacillus acetoxydans TaxID=1561005 RepID=A0A8S0XC43_9FIRM|nr:hypothetical protein [Acididesulfobacillus acetoxydans]CAA7601996.1 Galactose-binding domain-like [Acididesulfobacillus acetoxydans]CEJ08161.1 Hypothetical protein DEACI_2636 [Acididesulfobacillus acetoxydans]
MLICLCLSAYAYQWTNYINLTGPTTDPFTVSAYLKTGQTGPSNGACINVYWYDSSYNPIGVVRLFNVRSTNWQRYIATVTPPSGSCYSKVMAITYGPYDGYFDNVMFEKSPLARGYNLLENSSFELGSTQWRNSDSSATIVNDGSNAYSGSYDAQINRSSPGTSDWQSLTVLPVRFANPRRPSRIYPNQR